MDGDPKIHSREEDACYRRHTRWSDHLWSQAVEPRVIALIWKRVAITVVACAGAMVFISLAVVNAQDYVDEKEMKASHEKIEENVEKQFIEIKGILRDIRLDQKEVNLRVEDKLDLLIQNGVHKKDGE